jgi:hypothetical protein
MPTVSVAEATAEQSAILDPVEAREALGGGRWTAWNSPG